MKISHLTHSIFFLFVSVSLGNCAQKKPTEASVQVQQIEETGYCSKILLEKLNTAELYVRTYETYGMKYGSYLHSARAIYKEIILNYSSINCDARDSSNGQMQTITKKLIEDVSFLNDQNIENAIKVCATVHYPSGSLEEASCRSLRF